VRVWAGALLPLVIGFAAGACETSIGARSDAGASLDTGSDAATVASDAPRSEEDAPADDAAASAPDAHEPRDAWAAADAGPTCPPPGPMDCSPGSGTGEGDECYLGTSCFLADVQRAIRGVVDGHPEWFDASAGPTHVLQVEMYMDGVVAALNAGGLCAIRDPNAGDEIAVKWNNAASENFDILTASEDVRSGGGIYTSTCAPAWW